MFAKYTNELFNLMVEKGFAIINNEYSNSIISEDTTHITLYKRENAINYVVVLFNTEKFDLDEYKKVKMEMAKNLNNPIIRSTHTGIIVTNIFIGEDLPIVESTIRQAEKYIDQFYYEIFWAIKDRDNKIIHRVSKNQPSDILGLKKMIFTAYKNYKSDNLKNTGLTMVDTIKKIHSENPLKIVTKYSNMTFLFSLICVIYFLNEQYVFVTAIPNGLSAIETINYKNYIFIEIGALQRDKILVDREYYRLITSLFMHADFIHLISNLLALTIFGSRVEKYMGKLHFVLIFLIGGIVGNFLTVMFMSNVSVGASGSIFALIGTLYVISKKFNKSVDGLNSNLFFTYILINVCLGLLIPNINNIAHLGGLLFGLLAGVIYSVEKKEEK